TEALRREIDERLAGTGDGPRVRGVREYLRWRWTSVPPTDFPTAADDPVTACSFWDWDPAVLVRNLERLDAPGQGEAPEAIPCLLGHADERVQAVAVDALRRQGEARHLAQAVAQLDDPRGGAGESVATLLTRLDMDRREAAARLILHLSVPTPAQLAWALDQA